MNRQDLEFLQSQQKYPSVSIFVSCVKAMPNREGNQIAVKNLFTEAKDRLLKEFSKAELKTIFENMDLLMDSVDYTKESDGLVFFVNASVSQMYRLPFKVDSRVVIDSTFVTRDIVKALNRIPRYWVLALSKKPTRLFHGVGDTLTEIVEPSTDLHGNDKDGFPFSYLPPNVKSEHELMGDHLHRDAKYFDNFRREFFRKIDELVGRFVSVDEVPLVLVGDEKNCVAFREISKVKNILCSVHGDCSTASECDVAKMVWPVIEEHIAKEREKKIKEFEEAIGRMHHAFGLDSVWRVATEGRVNELIVEEGFSVPGVVDSENGQNLIVYDKSDSKAISDDIVNLLIEMVIGKGGKVIFCAPDALKEYEHVAAILRY